MATIAATAILELSAAAYDEIERKLLEAGYDHLFARGPGTGIDLSGIEVQREVVEVKQSLADITSEVVKTLRRNDVEPTPRLVEDMAAEEMERQYRVSAR